MLELQASRQTYKLLAFRAKSAAKPEVPNGRLNLTYSFSPIKVFLYSVHQVVDGGTCTFDYDEHIPMRRHREVTIYNILCLIIIDQIFEILYIIFKASR